MKNWLPLLSKNLFPVAVMGESAWAAVRPIAAPANIDVLIVSDMADKDGKMGSDATFKNVEGYPRIQNQHSLQSNAVRCWCLRKNQITKICRGGKRLSEEAKSTPKRRRAVAPARESERRGGTAG